MAQGHGRSHGSRRDRRRGHGESSGLTSEHHVGSRRRDDGTTPRGHVPARSIPGQYRRCQDRFLVNIVDVKIRLVRNKEAFAFMADGAYPAYQVQHRRRHLVREESHPEFARTVGAHQGSREETAKSTPSPREPCRTRTCSSAPCRHAWWCNASITTRTTVRSQRTRFTPNTTTSTSLPCTWTDDRYPPNLSSRFSPTTVTLGATSTCLPRPLRCGRMKGMT